MKRFIYILFYIAFILVIGTTICSGTEPVNNVAVMNNIDQFIDPVNNDPIFRVVYGEENNQTICWSGAAAGRNVMDSQTQNEVSETDGISDQPQLRRGSYLTEEAAREELKNFAETYSDLDGWIKRSENIRTGIRRGADLLPPPEKCALNPIIHSKRTYDGYTVENVAFESLPGFFVTGNLYKPLDDSGNRYPGIVCPHGHFPEPNGGGRFRPDQQIRCATLARMGAVVFSYDMIAWGESTQFEDMESGKAHGRYAQAVALQTWNSIRVVDFLESLSIVDPARMAVTGASGGGTQTFLLTALDNRIAVSAPVVMVSAHFFGGCACESGMPIHQSKDHLTNNVEIAALAAPRPMLLVSDGSDWTKNTPEVEFPYIQNIYRLYGAAENVENVHLPDEKHDYGYSKRKAVYQFFAKHLSLSTKDIINENGEIDESPVRIEPEKIMHVFDSNHPRPEYSVKFVIW